MWRCPKCRSKVDDAFEICWSCGTTPDGVEDPSFVTADDAEPIEDAPLDTLVEIKGNPLDDFAGTPWPHVVECYMAADTMEAKFVADQLTAEGIPAIADHYDINLAMGGFKPQMWGYGPKVRVRSEDLARATAWLETYDRYKKSRTHEK